MALVAAVVFLLGLCVGSFLNVVVFRTHEGRSIVRGRSRCTQCEVALGPLDLVPVVSYVLLKGRCRRCAAVISWQYPVVEFAVGALWVATYLRYALMWNVPANLIGEMWTLSLARDLFVVSMLTVIFLYDLRYTYILDRFTIPSIIIVLLLNLWIGPAPEWSLLAGGATLGLFFAVQYLVSKGTWIGGGDIRMGVLMGFLLGLRDGLVALFFAYMFGAIVGIYLIARRKVSWRAQVPFGTFLAVATLFTMFFGEPIVQWYLGLLM